MPHGDSYPTKPMNLKKGLFRQTMANPIRPWNLLTGVFKHAVLGTIGTLLLARGFTEGVVEEVTGLLMVFLSGWISWRDQRKEAADEPTRKLQMLGLLRLAVSCAGGVVLALQLLPAEWTNAVIAGMLATIASLASAKAPEKTPVIEERVWKAEIIYDDMDI